MNGNLWKIILSLIICNSIIIIVSIILSYIFREIAVINDVVISAGIGALLSSMGMCIHQYVKIYKK